MTPNIQSCEPGADLDRLVMILGDLKALCMTRLGVNPFGYSAQTMKRDALRLTIGEDTNGRPDVYVDARFATVIDSAAMAVPDAIGLVH